MSAEVTDSLSTTVNNTHRCSSDLWLPHKVRIYAHNKQRQQHHRMLMMNKGTELNLNAMQKY